MSDLSLSNSLADLAAQINAAHERVRDAAKAGLAHALAAGRLLLEAKAIMPHGEWLPWLEANCTASIRTAQAYMRAVNGLAKLDEANAQRVAHLSFRDALAALSKGAQAVRQMPSPVIETALALAEQDKSPAPLAVTARKVQRQAQLEELRPPPFLGPPPEADPDERDYSILHNAETRK